MNSPQEQKGYQEQYQHELQQLVSQGYGAVLRGHQLAVVLGLPTTDALRKRIARQAIDLKVYTENKRYCCLATEVARYLAEKGLHAKGGQQ